jgi:TonB family protein
VPAPVAELRKEASAPIAPPSLAVRTNVFTSEDNAKQTANLSPREVQTGGFGDPNGIRGKGVAEKPGNIASLGSFDLPVGSGAGNGTGGARGARAVIAGSAFGNAAETGRGSPAASATKAADRNIRPGGFSDGQAAASSQPARKVAEAPIDTPVEITFKPRPDYTEEARRLRLEGEVVVRVLFSAAGEVRVIEMVRGLGHGLDENAVRAAQRIRFKPALRNKEAVDSTALVHIAFQLAY